VAGHAYRRSPLLAAGVVAVATTLCASIAGATPNAIIPTAAAQVPGTLAPGTTAAVVVRATNTGDETWTAGQAFRLGALASNELAWSGFSCGGYTNRPADSRVFLCHDVPPGGSHDFRLSVTMPTGRTAPAVLGVRMVRDGVAWFGASASFSIVPASAYDAQFRVGESVVPASLAPAATSTVTVRVVNTGSQTWTAGAGYRLGTGPGNQLPWSAYACGGYMNSPGDGRVFLCHDVPPGGTHDFRFAITMPTGAATPARLSLRMVRDGVTWFGPEQGFAVERDDSCPTAALPVPADRWRMEIWNNRALAGEPVERRTDAAGPGGFAFDWGLGSASPCTGGDDFSVRFARTISVAEAGDYTFITTTDDGVRLWVDGTLLIDQWRDQPPTTHRATGFLAAGSHALAMDYYENGGGARAELRWERADADPEGRLYGMNIDPANPAGHPTPQQLLDIGVRWVRVEWKATHGLAFYDEAIAAYRDAGLEVLLIVDYASVPPKPRSDAGDATWVAYLQTFTTRLRDLAAHYRDSVDAWQIWNEPDLFDPGGAYDPGVPARHFGAMLRDGVAAIRPYSSRLVVTGGLASGNPGYLRAARDAVGGLFVDAVAVHPYGQRAPDGWPRSDWGFGDMSGLFDAYLVFGLPLWVSEIGTIDEPLQAQYLENVYRLARDSYSGRVQTVFWFCWSDGMVPPFGILRSSGEPKPAYDRYDAISPPW